MQKRFYKIAVCALLVIVFAITGNTPQAGYSSDSGIAQHFYYMFFHGGWLHLLCNCYALWLILNTRIFRLGVLLPTLYVIALLASFLSTLDVPTIGASAVVFGMLGINMSANHNGRSWCICASFLAIGLLMPGVNPLSHLSAFALGLLAALLYRKMIDTKNDYRAAFRGK